MTHYICATCGRVKYHHNLDARLASCRNMSHGRSIPLAEAQFTELRRAATEYHNASGVAARSGASAEWVRVYESMGIDFAQVQSFGASV